MFFNFFTGYGVFKYVSFSDFLLQKTSSTYFKRDQEKIDHCYFHVAFLLSKSHMYRIFSNKLQASNKRRVQIKPIHTIKLKKKKPPALIRGTGLYLRSSAYLKLNLYVTDSYRYLVIVISKRLMNHYSTSVQLHVILLIPTRVSWGMILCTPLSTIFSHLVWNFIDYRQNH